jgi:hypothetical protein
MDDFDEAATETDIRKFIYHELAAIKKIDPEQLVLRSENNFQWASTACKFITHRTTSRGSKPSDKFELILQSPASGLPGLYYTVLEKTFGFGSVVDDRVPPRFRMVIGRILDARRPLSRSSLRLLSPTLSDDEGDDDDVSLIVSCLGALFHGATASDEPIRPLHTSLRDFFNSETIKENSQDTGRPNVLRAHPRTGGQSCQGVPACDDDRPSF